MTAPLTAAQANAVWDILVEHAGASEAGREEFVFVEADRYCTEYRFMGGLGFSGKFWRTTGLHREDPDLWWSVTAYPEDIKRRPELRQMIDATNAALAGLDKARGESMGDK